MKRFILCAFVVLFVASIAAADTTEVVVSGSVATTMVSRSNVDDFDGDLSDDVGYVNVDAVLRVDAALTDGVSVGIELRTPQIAGRPLANGSNSLGAANAGLQLDEASISIANCFQDAVDVTIGMVDLEYSLRGDGNSLLLDTDSSPAMASGNAAVGGILVQYDADPVNVDLAYVKVAENEMAATSDLNAFVIEVDYMMDEESKIQGGLVIVDDRGATTANNGLWYNLALGCDYFVNEELEVYGEVAIQTGKLSDGAAVNEKISTMAFTLGGEYQFDADYEPFVGLSYTSLSGDKTVDDSQKNFQLLGDIDSTLIIEDEEYGVGAGSLSTNFTAIRLCGGVKPADNVSIDLSYSLFNVQSKAAGAKGDIGSEIDLEVGYGLTDDVQLSAALGMFLPGDAVAADADTAYLLTAGAAVSF